MAYGFIEKEFVESLAAELRATDLKELEHRFVVDIHKHPDGFLERIVFQNRPHNLDFSTKWGIVRYGRFPGRYDLGWLCKGFIWLEGQDIDRKLSEFRRVHQFKMEKIAMFNKTQI